MIHVFGGAKSIFTHLGDGRVLPERFHHIYKKVRWKQRARANFRVAGEHLVEGTSDAGQAEEVRAYTMIKFVLS